MASKSCKLRGITIISVFLSDLKHQRIHTLMTLYFITAASSDLKNAAKHPSLPQRLYNIKVAEINQH